MSVSEAKQLYARVDAQEKEDRDFKTLQQNLLSLEQAISQKVSTISDLELQLKNQKTEADFLREDCEAKD